MGTITQQVTEVYQSIVKTAKYDLAVATQFNNNLASLNVSVREMLEKTTHWVETSHLGSSLHFSLALISKLKAKQIESFLISTKNKNNFAVGYYNEKNHLLIADITKDVRFLSKKEKENNVPCRYASVPVQSFTARNGAIISYSTIFATEGSFFKEYLRISREIFV